MMRASGTYLDMLLSYECIPLKPSAGEGMGLCVRPLIDGMVGPDARE